MTTDDRPTSVWQGSFHVLGVEVKCHVLSDGQRIIEMDSMSSLLEAMDGNLTITDKEFEEFAKWQKGR